MSDFIIASKYPVLFDFDGTLGDTETPAMEVAFWELAPYLVDFDWSSSEKIEEGKIQFIRNNAGKAFEFMIENCDEMRKEKGLLPVSCEEARRIKKKDNNEKEEEDKKIMDIVNQARVERFHLLTMEEASLKYTTLLEQQKDETNIALAVKAVPNPGVMEMLETLFTEMHVPFCIATTSGKPRVPICVTACGFEKYFPLTKIHSGESDFTPSKFKPDPDVYQLAAKSENNTEVQNCIAVEDSGSGVGSAANAQIGLIVGYVGSSHIHSSDQDEHAKMLMSGNKSKDGRGAEIVMGDILDFPAVVTKFQQDREAGKDGRLFSEDWIVTNLKGQVWMNGEKKK